MTELKIDTKVVHGNKYFEPQTGAVSFPIYQSVTFRHPGLHQSTGYDYSREQNPTREELEKTMANLEGGKHGFAFASGMAAVSTVLSLFSPGDHIVVSHDLYGGTYRLFEEMYRRCGFAFSYVDTSSLNAVEESFNKQTRAIFLETPSNPMMKITDIEGVSRLARANGIISIVDNTFLTPYCQRPLELGADIVVHSGSKYLGGHNDTLAGFAVVKDDIFAERLRLIQRTEGAVLAPFDSWLILRGIKTLGVRLDKQQQSALAVAEWLKHSSKVDRVYFAGFPENPGFEIARRQASGFGAMISFQVKDSSLVEQVLQKVRLILFAESLGGVESLITYPVLQTHAAIPEEMRELLGVNDRLLRLSVGIEAAEDIIADLEQALG